MCLVLFAYLSPCVLRSRARSFSYCDISVDYLLHHVVDYLLHHVGTQALHRH